MRASQRPRLGLLTTPWAQIRPHGLSEIFPAVQRVASICRKPTGSPACSAPTGALATQNLCGVHSLGRGRGGRTRLDGLLVPRRLARADHAIGMAGARGSVGTTI